MKTFASFAATILVAASGPAAVSDFTATVVRNWNGREGVTFVRYDSKDSGRVYGSAFVFDLSKGYRLRAWLGDANADGANRATLGAMAENIFAEGGVAPIAGINGDYFNTDYDVARPTGMTISNSRRVHGGWSNGHSTDYCYIAELGDHNLYHGKLDCAAGYPGGDPTQSWQVNALGRKVRNAVRTNYQNYPVRAGAINPIGGGNSDSGYDFSTTIGNYQSRNYYYRTLIGIGTNAVGVATNLVLFSNTVYDGVLGIGDSPFRDVDAYQIMIDLGCNEVGELDGGGSATIWSESCPSLQNFFRGGTTAHGGYVNAYRDSSPRAIANGIFVMPPPTAPDTVAIRGANTYPDFDEALLAVVQSDPIAIVGEATISSTNAATGRIFSFTNAADAAKIRSVAEPGFFGEAVAAATAGRYTLNWTTNAPPSYSTWFAAESASNAIKGGHWRQVAVRSGGLWPIRPASPGIFEAYSSRDGQPRIDVTIYPYGGYLPSKLPELLEASVARGDRAALVAVEEDDGSISLRGLALVNGAPAWVALEGAVAAPGVPIHAAAEFDFSGAVPMVSYLAGGYSGVSAGAQNLSRLRFATGAVWLPATGFGESLAGGVAISGSAAVSALHGEAVVPAGSSAWRNAAASEGRGAYAVAVLGDLHFDTLPETVYHANYDESSQYAETQHAEFRRNGEMWRDRIPSLLAASSALATNKPSSAPATGNPSSAPATTGAGLSTRFLLQLGDLVQGDCYDNGVHRQMLDDALAATRAPYNLAVSGEAQNTCALPFLTLIGNHDYRNSQNGRGVYFDWAETLLSYELGEEVAFPLFSFRIDDDRWIFCDFERVSLIDVAAEIEADPEARYVFLVTHGPFTAYDSTNWRWRLSAWTGKGGTGEGVPELFEAISRRRAIVLSGHTHTTAFYRNENQYGGYTEFTANSVWEDAALATAEPIHDRPSQYGSYRRSQVSASLRAEYDADIAFFKAGLREYFFSLAAGHYRLEVTDSAVKMLFYPGDATEPGRVFDLTPGPPRFRGIVFTVH